MSLLRQVMRHHATTVTVVTAPGEPGSSPVGFTATSFTSVSLDPPLVSFCLDTGSSSWPAISSAQHVGVHILSRWQRDVAKTFATSGIDRFADVGWAPGPHGVPHLTGVLAFLLCRVADRVIAGDHAIVLAELLDASHSPEDPLLFHHGDYAYVR